MDEGPSRRDVRETFDAIATHFSKTRRYAWPEVESFVAEHSADETVSAALDVGCGNGRHTELLADVTERTVALDASRGLLTEAADRLADAESTVGERSTVDLVQADAATLPLTDDSVDLAVYVATIHHLPTREDRVASLCELARVLTPDACALVSAWSTAADRFDASVDADEGFDADLDWTQEDGETVPRFYHIYAPAEFEADVERAGLELVEFEISSGNCYAVVTPEGKRT